MRSKPRTLVVVDKGDRPMLARSYTRPQFPLGQLMAGDSFDAVAKDFGLDAHDLHILVEAANADWIYLPERQEICDLINAAGEREDERDSERDAAVYPGKQRNPKEVL